MIPQINKTLILRLIRFSFVGVFNTLLDLGILNLLIYLFNVATPLTFSICKGISFSLAIINSYFMNKYFTFIKKEKSRKEFYSFVLVSIIGLFINIVVSSILFYLIGLYPQPISIHVIATLSAIIGAIFSMIINYIGYSYFVFK